MNSSDWSAIATGGGAVVSAVALIFIYFQTKATRKAAEATRDQAEIAARALAVAERDHLQSKFLAAEAVKARIDVLMPRILLSVDDVVTWPPLVPSTVHLGSPQPHTSSEPFRLPRDGGRRLILRVHVSLTNESDSTVDVKLSSPLYRDNDDGQRIPLPSEMQLAPRQSAGEVYIDVERSVDEWVAIYEQRRAGEPGDEFEFTATYISPFDTGAIDRHRVVVGGTLVEPMPDQDAAWRVIGNPNPNLLTGAIGSVAWVTQPTTRTYYLSRTNGIELGPVDPTIV